MASANLSNKLLHIAEQNKEKAIGSETLLDKWKPVTVLSHLGGNLTLSYHIML